MGMKITEKILARASGKEKVVPGEIFWAKINKIVMHDVTSELAIDILNKNFQEKIAPNLEVIVTPDHYVPCKDIASAKLYQHLKNFVEEQIKKGADITPYMIEGGDYGVCHIMLPEKGHVIPGDVIIGGDSHTCTYGALGAFSTGVGSTEIGNALATGDMWFVVPESYKIEVNGKMPKNVMAKDLFLRVVGDIGVDGARYMAMEWKGSTIEEMCMDERMTLTNMAIEAGAKSGIIEPDDTTSKYLLEIARERGGGHMFSQELSERIGGGHFEEITKHYRGELGLFSDEDAQYSNIKKIDASGLEPLVAKPHLPSNVVPASELKNVKIDQAYIGSCTGGKWYDFIQAAEVLRGNKIAKGVRLLIVPSTADIQRRMIKEGLYEIFMDAGAVVSAPTCGACLGGYMGILAPGETCISSTNRNFVGRMGDPKSFVYLASPKTVAASAVEGHITGAEK
jgi:3-isopropylmalate/(R)-2-methylmalate dehydratase large subunit